MTDAVSVENLYEVTEKLDASQSGENLDDEFRTILKGTKSGSKEKRLASQLVSRYFDKFPALSDEALDALFDLCQDEDQMIRKTVIRMLPSLCLSKASKIHLSKVADVLTQLLQTDDTQEHLCVCQSLKIILNKYPKDTMAAVFQHLTGSAEDLLRERALKFILLQIRNEERTKFLTKDIEDFVVEEMKKVLAECNGDEFILCIGILSSLPSMETVQGRKQLLDIITDQAELDQPFDPEDTDRVDQVVQCVRQALKFFSKNVPSTAFLNYFLDHVVLVFDKVPDQPAPSQENQETAPSVRLEMLQLLADLCASCGNGQGVQTDKSKIVLQKLTEYLPLPPAEPLPDLTANGAEEGTENSEEKVATAPGPPNIQYSYIECLLWTLHQLGKIQPNIFADESEESMKDFKRRLQYLASRINDFSRKLRRALQAKTNDEKKKKLRLTALQTTSNINTLLKDLLRPAPIFKASIRPSWGLLTQKRPTEAEKTVEPIKKISKKHETQEIYHPPGGKYSDKVKIQI